MTDFSFTGTPEYKRFIEEYSTADTISLRLKNFADLPFDKEFAIRQIECRRKAKNKIPELSASWLFPTGISIEQCTAETIARFHATLFDGCENVVDFTCGLGIDAYYISKNVGHLTTIDINSAVAETAKYNFKNIGAGNITVINGDSEGYASNIDTRISAAFIDQSRRNGSGTRKYNINDCEPDLKKIISSISGKTGFLIAKTSPMIDITDTLRQFDSITDIWIISLRNECKELLFKFTFQNEEKSTPLIHTLNFETDHRTQYFACKTGNDTPAGTICVKEPAEGDLIILPNASIMKAGLFKELCKEYSLCQISDNSHIFIATTGTQPANFPGKTYKIGRIYSLSKPDIKNLRQTTASANIACRNFPLSPEELYKRLKIKTGGELYIFATTTCSGKRILLLCEKIDMTNT